MATANPYTGQPGMDWYEHAWNMGYYYGQQNPAQDQPPPPSVFPPIDVTDDYLAYMQQVWSEGELAGRTDGGLRAPAPTDDSPSANPAATAFHVVEGGHAAYEVGRGVVQLVTVGVEGVASISAGVIGFLAMIIGATEPGPADDQTQLQEWFAGQCQSRNCGDFYLAAYWPDSTQAPPWYGTVHNTFDGARDEAAQYLGHNPGRNVQVAHYQASSPGQLELISLADKTSQGWP